MDKKEFDRRKEILELEQKLKMERLKYERESNNLFHEQTLTRGRIKSAEIRKMQMRKQDAFRH